MLKLQKNIIFLFSLHNSSRSFIWMFIDHSNNNIYFLIELNASLNADSSLTPLSILKTEMSLILDSGREVICSVFNDFRRYHHDWHKQFQRLRYLHQWKKPSRPTSLFFETKLFLLLSCFLTLFWWSGASRPQKLHALLHPWNPLFWNPEKQLVKMHVEGAITIQGLFEKLKAESGRDIKLQFFPKKKL